MKYKVPVNIVKASAQLLTAIINHYEGSKELGDTVGMSRQAIHNYKRFGYVPLFQVYSIAKDLKVSVWVLSYSKLCEVFGTESPTFRYIVEQTNLLPAVKQKLLKLVK